MTDGRDTRMPTTAAAQSLCASNAFCMADNECCRWLCLAQTRCRDFARRQQEDQPSKNHVPCQAVSHWIVSRTRSTLCLIAQRIAISGYSIWTSCSIVVLLQTLRICANQMHAVVSLGNVLHVGSKSLLCESTELNFLSVGSRLPPRTSNIC